MEELKDLQQIYSLAVSRFREYKGNDFVLPLEFKETVTEINSYTIHYNEYTAVIETGGNPNSVLNIFLPNQWFYIASYFTDFYNELQRYRNEALKFISRDRLKELNGHSLNQSEKDKLQTLPLSSQEKSFLETFVTDYSWWNGAKTIDRGDFFVSPILSAARLVNASQSFVAELCSFLADKSDLVQMIISGEKPAAKEQSSENQLAFQIIFYGPPGTGKSYNIDKDLKVKNIPETQVKRVIFYPDYTYTDFIGGLLPITDEDDKPKYKFVAGPFTEILKDAFDNSDKSYYIVIEEINRGNPAAIFGDVFQLLDRDSSGKSKYTITNKDICSYLRGNDKDKFANDRFWLPSNFNIICTMNTADQNVFVLDTAFKRRFKMEYVPIDFKKLNKPELEKYIKETDVFAGEKSLKEIFANTDLGTYVSEHEAEMKRNWPTFAQLVNEKINLINRSGDSISEDKKLGPFFISIDELTDKRKFADKVLYYLKQDVFKYTDSVLTPSYQKLYDDFVNGDDDIFELFATAK